MAMSQPNPSENLPGLPDIPGVAAGATRVGDATSPTDCGPKPGQHAPSAASRNEPQADSRVRWAWWSDTWISNTGAPSWLVSAAVHATAVLLLSLLVFRPPATIVPGNLEATFASAELAAQDLDLNQLSAAGGELAGSGTTVPPADTSRRAENMGPLPLVAAFPADMLAGIPNPSLPDSQSTGWLGAETIGQPLASIGGGLEGRQPQNRRGLALQGGGSLASESAVELGLAWLAAHQFQDGGWRFDLESCPQCGGACRNSGFVQATTSPTGLALLSFLGAGYTQQAGPYQETVSRGLYYVVDQMLLTADGGDLRDQSIVSEKNDGILLVRKSGDMYSHAIATLALCEAYAMTGDENLAAPAQQAVDFIVHAQHDQGGWRYQPGEPGDTSVTTWQLTALKSAALGRLKIPREVWYRASHFLDGVQEDRGASYGYQLPSSQRRSMSVAGLFSRMMLGWPHNHPPLRKGLARIAKQVPAENDMYFNYYASQALHHFGGPGWKRWNPKMRAYLIDSQATSGHEAGSWYFEEAWSKRGGRLYTTTLAILTLEVYYRHMPMYQQAFIGESP